MHGTFARLINVSQKLHGHSRMCTSTQTTLAPSSVGTPTVRNESPDSKKTRKASQKGLELPLKPVPIDQIHNFPIHNKQSQLSQNNCVFRSYKNAKYAMYFLR